LAADTLYKQNALLTGYKIFGFSLSFLGERAIMSRSVDLRSGGFYF